MSESPAPTVLTRRTRRSSARRGLYLASRSADAPVPLLLDGVGAVEIVAPDRESALLLVECVGGAFPGELLPGPSWIVRFREPAAGGDWVVDLLALVERWLAAAPLPCAKLLRGGRSYLIRGPLDAA